MRSKISEIIDDNIKDRTLTLSDKHSFNIDDGSGSDSIEFTDIEFNSSFFIFKDDFVQINALNNKAKSNIGKLSINNKVITQIHIEKIHTTLDINITDIKTITFTNFKFDFLPTILFDKIWQIKFNNCEFYDRSSNWISNILRPTNKNKKVYFNDCTIKNFTLGEITDIQYNLDKKLCNFELVGGDIHELSIKNIEIASKVYINKQHSTNDNITKIIKLNITNSIFKENFKLHHCQIDKIIIKDADFDKHANFNNTTFGKLSNKDTIYFEAVNFKGLALFGHSTFNQKVSFRYVTFEDFSHFKNAIPTPK